MSITTAITLLGVTLALGNLALIYALNGIRADFQRIATALENKL